MNVIVQVFKIAHGSGTVPHAPGVFSEHIRCPGGIFITLNWAFQSLDTELLAKKRLETVNKIISEVDVIKATGNVTQIKNEIINKLEQM